MSWISIVTQIIQLIWTLISIWRSGGSLVMKETLAQHKKHACDKKCELELKRDATRGNI